MSRELRPLASLAMVALIIAGCSNASDSDGTGDNTAANQEQAVKFAECMRENGASEFPDPDASGEFPPEGGEGTAAYQTALAACKDLQPPGFIDTDYTAEEQEARLDFAQCMRDNGVEDFPDPVEDGALIDTTRIPSAAGRGALSIPGFQAAADKCTDVYSGVLGLGDQ